MIGNLKNLVGTLAFYFAWELLEVQNGVWCSIFCLFIKNTVQLVLHDISGVALGTFQYEFVSVLF